jgi:Heliorhodopsin
MNKNNLEIRQIDSQKLFKWNLVMGCLHLLQGLVMFFLSKDLLRPVIWTLPKPAPLPVDFNPNGGNMERGRQTVIFVSETWVQLNLGQTIAFFLFLSAFAHFITILPKVYPWYLKNLAKKINLIRWYEYALSSSLMIVVIAMLCNITDAGTLILLFSINLCMNLFGALMELYNAELRENAELEGREYKTNWLPFIYGCFAGFIPWVVMGVYFFVSISRLSDLENLPQKFKDILNTIKFIFPTLFVFFNLFAINMYLQYSKIGKWKDYLFGEKTYILLSLVAKSFLAWFIWGGTLR